MRNWALRALVPASLLSVAAAPFVANRLEPHLIQPTAQIMTFLLTGRFAEHTFEEGVPQVYYRRMGERYANPVYASVYALWYYQTAHGTNEFDYFLDFYNIDAPPEPAGGYVTYFQAVADWLVDDLVLREYDGVTYGVWEYGFPWEVYRLEPGWVSGMAQGLGIQVLLRAWSDSGAPKYLEAITLARRSFEVPVDAGGVTLMEGDTSWWYEEYASPGAIESRVFNGAAHAVIALLELAEVGDDAAKGLAERGLASILDSLAVYDAGWWTYYDALGLMSNYKYHHVNVNLTRHLGERTGNQELLATAERWSEYRLPFFQREFLRQRPQVSDVALFLLAGGITFVTSVAFFSIVEAVRGRRRIAGATS